MWANWTGDGRTMECVCAVSVIWILLMQYCAKTATVRGHGGEGGKVGRRGGGVRRYQPCGHPPTSGGQATPCEFALFWRALEGEEGLGADRGRWMTASPGRSVHSGCLRGSSGQGSEGRGQNEAADRIRGMGRACNREREGKKRAGLCLWQCDEIFVMRLD